VEERHLSLSEVAQILDKSERTIRRWVKSGKLKAYKPGRDYLIPESAIRELMERSEVYPKAQAQLPFEAPQEADLAKQQRQWFLQQAPSSAARVMRLRRTAEIAAGYSGRWREERGRIEEEGTYPYGKFIEMDQLWEGFHEAINVDGTYPYMVWVLAEDIEVPTIEREACCNLDDALTEMLTEISEMRRVEAENKQRADVDAERGLQELETSLARTSQEGAG
jgi:excisionase family DNA binding protein